MYDQLQPTRLTRAIYGVPPESIWAPMHDLPGKPCPGLPDWDMLHTRAVQTHNERTSLMAFLATRQSKPNL